MSPTYPLHGTQHKYSQLGTLFYEYIRGGHRVLQQYLLKNKGNMTTLRILLRVKHTRYQVPGMDSCLFLLKQATRERDTKKIRPPWHTSPGSTQSRGPEGYPRRREHASSSRHTDRKVHLCSGKLSSATHADMIEGRPNDIYGVSIRFS